MGLPGRREGARGHMGLPGRRELEDTWGYLDSLPLVPHCLPKVLLLVFVCTELLYIFFLLGAKVRHELLQPDLVFLLQVQVLLTVALW